MVIEAQCWSLGKDKAISILRASQLFTADELSPITYLRENVDMLHPHGIRIGANAGNVTDEDN